MCKLYRHTRKLFLVLMLFLSVALSAAGCRSSDVSAPKDIVPPEGEKDINRTQLYYKVLGKGPPIFFLHGRSGSHRYFLPHIEPLSDKYQLLFYDQRGTGSSNGQLDLQAISIDQFVEDLEALRVAFGFGKISLVGHSRGAIIVLFYAFKYPDHLNKLILVDPVPLTNTFLVEQNQSLKQRAEHLSLEAQHMLTTTCQRSNTELSSEARTECIKLDAALRFFDPAKALTMDMTTEKNTVRNAATIESLLTTSFNRKQRDIDATLKTIHVPALIIHGDFDPIPIGASKYIQQRISGAQLVIIQQSGHFPFVEQPEKVLATIRAFMQP
jgi:proline iminopeptidase